MKSGIDLIAEERHRQLAKLGWSAGHDDEHDERELARAGLAYVENYVARWWVYTNALCMSGVDNGPLTYKNEPVPESWPWDDKDWKPEDPMRDLVKAGALIAAEIDRLQRAKDKPRNSVK